MLLLRGDGPLTVALRLLWLLLTEREERVDFKEEFDFAERLDEREEFREDCCFDLCVDEERPRLFLLLLTDRFRLDGRFSSF